MSMVNSRLDREKRTIRAMIEIYCRKRHKQAKGLCAECEGLFTYVLARINKCPFGEDKPTCAKCTIHCYKPQMREQVRRVMRYAGPRMLLAHPVLTVMHYFDELKHARKGETCGGK
jgi:hypothetical protein